MDLGSKIIGQLLKGLPEMPQMPDMSGMMNGYEFKDGSLKPVVEYWVEGDKDLEINAGVIWLRAAEDVHACMDVAHIHIKSTLSLLIKAQGIAFIYELLHPFLADAGATPIIPDVKETVAFNVKTEKKTGCILKKGDFIGYGMFVPYIPTNNISFNKQNASTSIIS